MQLIKLGARGPAAAEIRTILVELGLLASRLAPPDDPNSAHYDAHCERAVRGFQQARGLSADGIVGSETWRALVAARYRLGDRVLSFSVNAPMVGDDIHALQERLLEMGYDVGRADGIYHDRTERAVRAFQRECGLPSDGLVGPTTMRAFRRLARKVVGGRPQLLREAAMLDHAGPRISGKRLVIDPGHGVGSGITIADGDRWFSEAEICHDIALRLRGRFVAVGGQAELTRGLEGNPTPAERADFANRIGADLLVSIHNERHDNPVAHGVASYHFGTAAGGVTSTIGERLAGLVQREIVARTGIHDCRTHAKTWEILRLTRMPAVLVEVGYLTSPTDRARLAQPDFRDTIAEAILVAVQRIFLPIDSDVHTGTLNLDALRALQLRT